MGTGRSYQGDLRSGSRLVGRALARLLESKAAELRDRYGIECEVAGVDFGEAHLSLAPGIGRAQHVDRAEEQRNQHDRQNQGERDGAEAVKRPGAIDPGIRS